MLAAGMIFLELHAATDRVSTSIDDLASAMTYDPDWESPSLACIYVVCTRPCDCSRNAYFLDKALHVLAIKC